MARRTYSWLLALLSVVSTTSNLVRAATATSNVVEGAFIVEYEDGTNLDSALASMEDVASTSMKLDFTLFKGASIRFHDVGNASTQAAQLRGKTPAIKNMWPVKLYGVPKYTVDWVAGEDALTTDNNNNDNNGQGETVAARQAAAAADMFSPHVMTQVNQLRDDGTVGEGIKVAVIDTGVDYRHPSLGGCFGPGCLVSFGYDFVGDDYTGGNTAVPDADPFDCEGHGTHVSGIVAAQPNNPYGIIGAATGVTLGAYRVFGCVGNSANDILIAAFNKAYDDGADIITASIGGPSGWSEEPWAVAVSRIVDKGVPCTISAGNDGQNGLFYASTAANGKGIAAVGSVDNTVSPSLLANASYITLGTTGAQEQEVAFGFAPGVPAAWANVTLPLWAVNYNTSDPVNACAALPDDTPDLAGYVVLVRRGTCTFVSKLQNVAAKGARYVVFYNNVPAGTVSVDGSAASGIQAVAMVEASQGATWIEALSSGQQVTLAMTDPETAGKFLISANNTATGGTMSTFSSWGPTYEVDFKPQLSAPGGAILSTYPTALGSYAVASGTSMACPLVAAIYALLMDVRGTKEPTTLENVLASTAKPLSFNDGTTTYPLLAPAVQQGAGLVQVYDAAYTKTYLGASSLSFNDTDHLVAEANFTIFNEGTTAVVYTLRNVGAATGLTLASGGDIFPASFPNELYDDYATLTFGPNGASVTVPAGDEATVLVQATPPTGLDATRLPVYSGYLALDGSDGSRLSLPYIGVAGALQAATVLAPDATYLTGSAVPATAADPIPAVAEGHAFVLPPPPPNAASTGAPPSYNASLVDFPQIVYSLALGTAVLRMDVVPLDADNVVADTVLGVTTIGAVASTPMVYLPRNTADLPNVLTWTGRLAGGAYAPAGSYRLAVRALKIFGDRTVAEDYELVQTVGFSIRYLESDTS